MFRLSLMFRVQFSLTFEVVGSCLSFTLCYSFEIVFILNLVSHSEFSVLGLNLKFRI